MNRSAIIIFVVCIACASALISESIYADSESSEPERLVIGAFSYEILQGTDLALVQYLEDSSTIVDIPATVEIELEGVPLTFHVVEISSYSFDNCEHTTTVDIPNSVRYISPFAFSSVCFESFMVDDDNPTYSDVDGVLFEKKTHNLIRYPPSKSVTEYSVPDEVPQIATNAFSDAQNLENLSVGANVLLVGDYAFYTCLSLESVSFAGSGPGIIGTGAFFGCAKLTSISLPPELKSIGEMAFGGCVQLTSFEIPENVTYIGESVFQGCASLEEIITGDNKKFTIRDHALCSIDSQSRIRTLIAFPAACGITEFIMPDSIDYVEPYAFSDSRIKKLVISPNMTSIGMLAFANMTYLESVEIPKTVSKIDYGAFMNCTRLKSVDTGENTYLIEEMAFDGCTSLKDVVLHENLTEIQDMAFDNTAIETILIPWSVNILGAYVFDNCEQLTFVQIDSKNVEARYAFANASHTITVKCYEGALKNLGSVSDNVVFVNFEKRTFPMMNLVGIAVCLIILLLILNFLRRI